MAHVVGAASFDPASNSFSVSGAGQGFSIVSSGSYGTQYAGYASDSSQFVYQPITGNARITFRVNNFSQISSVAGLLGPMIRESTDDTARQFWGFIGNNLQGVQYRSIPNYPVSLQTNPESITCPLWMRLERFGSTFTYSTSTDGTNWQLVAQQNIAMTDQVLVGLAIDSGSTSALALANIDSVRVDNDANGTVAATVDPNLHILKTVASVTGSQAINPVGNWIVDGTTIYDQDFRGSVSYTMSTDHADIYELSVTGQPRGKFNSEELYNIDATIDGLYIGRFPLTSLNGAPGTFNCLTPYISSGRHLVTLYWDNTYVGRSFQIDSVTLNTLGDSSNSEAWEKTEVASHETLDHSTLTSPTSPACLEGDSLYPELITISGGLKASHGAGDRWYANLPLQSAGVTPYTVSQENGEQILSGQVQWLPTEIFTSPSLTIRQGDSLLLTVKPPTLSSGNAQIVITPPSTATSLSVSALNVPIGTAQPFAFTQPGLYLVKATIVGSSLTATLQVNVVSSSFDGSPLAWIGRERVWNCPNLISAPQVIVDADPRITCTEQALSTGGSQLNILVDAAENRYVVARLGASGPILANGVIQGMYLASSDDSGVSIVQTYPDGSSLVQMTVVTSTLNPNLNVQINIFAGGVTFDDGTVSKTLTAADFNALGVAKVFFLYPAGTRSSICHFLSVYDGTNLVGNR